MTDSGSTQASTWPLPKFYFSVTFGNGVTASFQEVTGLETPTMVIEYRHGDSTGSSPIKMPGLGNVGNVTMKKGIFTGDTTFWNWYDQITMNTIARTTVIVNLLDETGAPKYVWTLNQAWPTKLSNTNLESDGNEVAVESLELSYETMTISGP